MRGCPGSGDINENTKWLSQIQVCNRIHLPEMYTSEFIENLYPYRTIAEQDLTDLFCRSMSDDCPIGEYMMPSWKRILHSCRRDDPRFTGTFAQALVALRRYGITKPWFPKASLLYEPSVQGVYSYNPVIGYRTKSELNAMTTVWGNLTLLQNGVKQYCLPPYTGTTFRSILAMMKDASRSVEFEELNNIFIRITGYSRVQLKDGSMFKIRPMKMTYHHCTQSLHILKGNTVIAYIDANNGILYPTTCFMNASIYLVMLRDIEERGTSSKLFDITGITYRLGVWGSRDTEELRHDKTMKRLARERTKLEKEGRRSEKRRKSSATSMDMHSPKKKKKNLQAD